MTAGDADAHGAAHDDIVTLTDATFTDATARGTWLVDFWAEWCQPCHALLEVLVELAPDLRGDVTVARVEVTEEPEVARRHDVTSLPTVLVFDGGTVQRRLYGAKNRRQLLAAVEPYRARPTG